MKVSLVTMGGCSKIVDIKGMLPLSVKTEGFIDSVDISRLMMSIRSCILKLVMSCTCLMERQ